MTKNFVPGESVYNEKRISVDDRITGDKVFFISILTYLFRLNTEYGIHIVLK